MNGVVTMHETLDFIQEILITVARLSTEEGKDDDGEENVAISDITLTGCIINQGIKLTIFNSSKVELQYGLFFS